MPFKDGSYYCFDCLAHPRGGILTPDTPAPTLAQAQDILADRVARDRRAGQKFHYELWERTNSTTFTHKQTDQS